MQPYEFNPVAFDACIKIIMNSYYPSLLDQLVGKTKTNFYQTIVGNGHIQLVKQKTN